MVARASLATEEGEAEASPDSPEEKSPIDQGGSYFASEDPNRQFISSGCQLLDCVLGGGYPLGRIVNIVGDRSTGKTLLAIEATANFAHNYPDGKIWYREAEAAFDTGYAEALGMPIERIDFGEESESFFTVEDIYRDMEECIKEIDNETPGLYILDSLDALSDKAELERKIDDGTYGAAKAKKLSELFRRLVQKLEHKKITVVIISQVRDNIGAAFGEKHSRSGGRALDFYASQVLYLANLGQIKETKNKITRPVGVNIRAKTKKNKVGLPFRECDVPLYFGYGLDDVQCHLDWLDKVGKIDRVLTKDADTLRKLNNRIDKMPDSEYEAFRAQLSQAVKEEWREIETGFLPKRRKYS